MSSFGIAFSVLLVITVVGIYNSLDVTITDSIVNSGAEIWVGAEGSTGSLHSPSILSSVLQENIRAVQGVSDVQPLVRTGLQIELNGKRSTILLQGYVVDSGLRCPPKVIRGSSNLARGEAIIDKVLAAKNGLDIGDNIRLGENDFRIVVISEGTNLFIFYGVYVPFEDATRHLSGIVTNYLIKVDSSANVDVVVSAIENNVAGVTAMKSGEFAQSIKTEILSSFLPIIFVIVLVGLVVGATVVGLTIYALTVERIREYGILKALGASNRYLTKSLLNNHFSFP